MPSNRGKRCGKEASLTFSFLCNISSVKKAEFVFTHLDHATFPGDFSIISVASYFTLALFSVTISFRAYKSVIQAVQKSKKVMQLHFQSSSICHNYDSDHFIGPQNSLFVYFRSGHLHVVNDFSWCSSNGIALPIFAELYIFSIPMKSRKPRLIIMLCCQGSDQDNC
ncbi:LOW QUALITY PROTEIN: Reticulon-3 [Plecturocebus cupreus]